jgi:hypothetical protein
MAQYVYQQIYPNVYRLSPIEDFVGGYGSRPYEVTYNEEHIVISYQCYKFQKDGIFCYHVLKVLTDKGVKKFRTPTFFRDGHRRRMQLLYLRCKLVVK